LSSSLITTSASDELITKEINCLSELSSSWPAFLSSPPEQEIKLKQVINVKIIKKKIVLITNLRFGLVVT